jgi:hypothetical protein
MWRTDADGPNGVRTTIFNGNDAQFKHGSETENFLAFSLAEGGNWWFPWLSILGEWSEANIQVDYLGVQGTEHKLRLHRLPRDTAFRDLNSPCDVYLDSTSLLPTRFNYRLHPADNLQRDILAEVKYSDYRNFAGVHVPFQLSYSIRGVLIFESRIINLAVNQGTTEAEFSVK